MIPYRVRGAPDHCPNCKTPTDSFSGVGHDARPNPGDFGLCFYCGKWMVLDTNLRRRLPNEKEQRYIRRSKVCRQAEQTWRDYKLQTMSTDGPKN